MNRQPMKSYRTCQFCHCREDRACFVPDGDGGFEPCHWVGPRLCSNPSCVTQAWEKQRQGERGLLTNHAKTRATRHTTKDGREICRSEYAWLLRRRDVWMRDQGCCVACGKPVALPDASVDHIEPRRMGGGSRDDRPENLRTMCFDCHWKRHAAGAA